MRFLIALLLITSCHSVDYYTSDSYKIKQRQKESLRMFDEVHSVRKKCSPNKKSSRSKRRKKYYS